MQRRDFLKTAGAAYGSSLLSNSGTGKLLAQSPDAVRGPQPNILFILVDELRFPSAFPKDVPDANCFLRRFMPQVHSLWKDGVKFGSHYTAANACTPARGTLISGLYSQQSWLLNTLIGQPAAVVPPSAKALPVLNPAYPTFGKLLRRHGYTTPYCGKWHVSIPNSKENGLDDYGFDYKLYPDPIGFNMQGTYGDESKYVDKHGKQVEYIYHNDADSVDAALKVMDGIRADDGPFCLTVSLINPHDREFFPAGTEFETVDKIFDAQTSPDPYIQQTRYPENNPVVPWHKDKLKNPPDYNYPTLPPNWESTQDLLAQHKPTTQPFIKDFSQLVWGGASDNPSQTDFTIEKYVGPTENLGVLKAPFSYWQRGMDSYTQIMEIVDHQIGRVLHRLRDLPPSVVENTIIIFASDHGEYSGAHGILQGKVGTVYEEAFHIPLIVYDPSNRFTRDVDDIRTGLTSSVDMLPLFASLGARGTNAWLTPRLRKIYGGRHDLLGMLASSKAPGRSHVLMATDEIVPKYYNPTGAPTHILGLRTPEYKLGVYADWNKFTSDIDPSSIQLEFYDYATQGGRMELLNTTRDPRAKAGLHQLMTDLIPNELQQPLPPSLRLQQLESKAAHLIFRDFLDEKPENGWSGKKLRELLGYGGPF